MIEWYCAPVALECSIFGFVSGGGRAGGSETGQGAGLCFREIV